MTFDGFPEDALVFYEGLQADNTKAYWSDHKAMYDACVKAPMEALLDELEPEFGAATFFRPYRDVRFAKDKTPYKDHAGAVVRYAGDSGLYVQLGADGLLLAGGCWRPQTDQAQRLRAAVADDLSGSQLQAVLDDLAGWTIGGDRLKRLPKPYDAEHPRADLLHHKSLTASQAFEPAEWMHEPECGTRIAEGWRALGPLNSWLGQHVGPTTRPARERR